MTSVFMIFEITQDYQILVPLMIANMLSFMISRRFQPVPLYHALLHQDGIHLPSPATQASMRSRTAQHLMHTDLSFIAADSSVEHAWQWALEHDAPAYLVGSQGAVLGLVTRGQLEDWRASQRPDDAIGPLLADSFVHVHPDHPLDIVLDRLSETDGFLPVVSRTNARHVEGVVTQDSILAAGGRHRRAHNRPPR
jgi:CIC family chloride channel protein